jgi:ribosomal protein S18 acetylase RimI-like enzyme
MSSEQSPPRRAIRIASSADVPALVGLMREFYAESGFELAPAAAARTFERLIEAPALGQVWLMESGGEAAGYVVLTVSFSMEYGNLRGYVDDLFVRAACRRRGLGSLALEEVQRGCDRRGVRALLVETGPDNEVAQRVYRRAGFAESGRQLLTLELGAPLHQT